MTYNKPEVAVLGEAAVLIQGQRIVGTEPKNDGLQGPADCEFDD
jgi:hypothetical protein